jgi:hypothetical protein
VSRRLGLSWLAAVAAAFVALLQACSFLVSTSSLTSDTADATDTGEASVVVDGSDEGIAPDAGKDGGERFCLREKHDFCEDFDGPDASAAGSDDWRTGADPPAMVTISTEQSASAPAALAATTPRLPADAGKPYASMFREFSGPWRRTVFQYDVFVVRPLWQSGDVNFGSFCMALRSDGQSNGPCMSFGEAYSNVGLDGEYANGNAMQTGRWVHVKVDLDPSGNLEVDLGEQVMTLQFVPYHPNANPRTGFEVGILAYNAPVPDFHVYVDNVTVDFL